MTMLVKEAMEQNLPIILFKGHNGVITLTHDKQWIKAKKDIDTRKEYWISLDDGKIMSHYNYNKEDRYVDVKSVMQWFSNAQIITYDYRFAKIALFNKQSYELKTYSSPIRFIQALGEQSTIYEEWDATGIKIKELEEMLNTYNVGEQLHQGYRHTIHDRLYSRPNEIDKQLLSILKQYKEPLSIARINEYCRAGYGHKTHIIFQQLLEYEAKEEYSDLFLAHQHGWRNRFKYESILSTDNHRYDREKLLSIIEQYNLDIDRFVKYLRELKDFERTNIQWVIDNYKDYLDAELFLRGGKLRKVNKYPNNLVQMHHNRTSVMKDIELQKEKLKDDERREKDKKIYESYKYLEYKPKKSDYCIVVPEDCDDVIEEGNKLSHCVGGYVSRISDEETFIIFMRRQKMEDIPFITVEVRNGRLCTALGKFNRRLEPKEKKFLQKFANKKGLEYTAYPVIE